MRVLFIGEGPHDIGRHDHFAPDRSERPGVVQVLARKVCPHIANDSPALRWSDLWRFHPDAKKRGFAAKMAAAVMLAERNHECVGVVCVTDRDGDDDRERQVREGAVKLSERARIAWGVAHESIEAWTLGAPDAIAESFGLTENVVRAEYPSVHVESLYENSGREEHRPKPLLARIAGLAKCGPGREFRVAVAERTDITRLERACPSGFAAFTRSLRETFGEES